MGNGTRITDQSAWQMRFGFFAGPVLWGLQILLGYGLASVSCSIAGTWPEYILLALSALIVLPAALLAHGAWRRSPGYEGSVITATNYANETSAFVAVSASFMSLLFFVLIVATLAVDIYSSPCAIITIPMP